MAEDEKPGDDDARRPDEPDDSGGEAQTPRGPSAPPAAGKGGFFRIYKPGQGYWTRMGTAATGILLIIILARYIYVLLSVHTTLDVVEQAGKQTQLFPMWKLSIVGALSLLAAGFGWHLMNKPSVADFMIATESEMKKVNWTSRKDLIGSTKVVIFFMFLIAAALFVIDLWFGYSFYLIGVLKNKPL
jgi:preprotein translocase SecE subunit